MLSVNLVNVLRAKKVVHYLGIHTNSNLQYIRGMCHCNVHLDVCEVCRRGHVSMIITRVLYMAQILMLFLSNYSKLPMQLVQHATIVLVYGVSFVYGQFVRSSSLQYLVIQIICLQIIKG